jgi:hypothetical protein
MRSATSASIRPALWCGLVGVALVPAVAAVSLAGAPAVPLTASTKVDEKKPVAPPAPTRSPAVNVLAEPSFSTNEERSRFLSQTAEKIAILRQQQALVEAQVALAKARADLATAGAAASGAVNAGNVVTNSGVLKKTGKANYGAVELLGIQGTPKRRWANVAVAGGAVQQVRLSEVLLEPLGQGGEPTLLRVEGSVERAPDGPAAVARPSGTQSTRKAGP